MRKSFALSLSVILVLLLLNFAAWPAEITLNKEIKRGDVEKPRLVIGITALPFPDEAAVYFTAL